MPQKRYKYPRTPHIPWSPGVHGDDVVTGIPSGFEVGPVVVTEKMDGENTTLYADGLHARSTDSRHHPSRDWIKQLHGRMGYHIPRGYRVCGENMYARHSLSYTDLESYFYIFSVWNEDNVCLSWTETKEWAALLELPVVPVLYEGPWDEHRIRNLDIDTTRTEGYVVRTAQAFRYEAFGQNMAKWVRAYHVQTNDHWMSQPVVPNRLKKIEDES